MSVPVSLLFLATLLSSSSSPPGVAAQIENLRDNENFVLNETLFLDLLTDLIAAAEFAQQPEPIEEFAANIIIDFLQPYVDMSNGFLTVRKAEYVERRPNVIVHYKAAFDTNDTIGLIGSHLDVVAADPATWDTPPFELTIGPDGDRLTGRGVSDCHGNIAVISLLFRELVLTNTMLDVNLVAMFIANEESSDLSAAIGIDALEDNGEFDELQDAPFFWVDTQDFGPKLGSAGALLWTLTAHGVLGHSGRPLNGINAIHLCTAAVEALEVAFYERFPMTEADTNSGFVVGTNMKPTIIRSGNNVINQIPDTCVVEGDLRVTPVYKNEEVKEFVDDFIANLDVAALPTPPGYGAYQRANGEIGTVEINVVVGPFTPAAVDLESPNLAALREAITQVRGEVPPIVASGGSLPIIGDLIAEGFDVQIMGFGRGEFTHGDNEYGYLSDFADGFQVLNLLLQELAFPASGEAPDDSTPLTSDGQMLAASSAVTFGVALSSSVFAILNN